MPMFKISMFKDADALLIPYPCSCKQLQLNSVGHTHKHMHTTKDTEEDRLVGKKTGFSGKEIGSGTKKLLIKDDCDQNTLCTC